MCRLVNRYFIFIEIDVKLILRYMYRSTRTNETRDERAAAAGMCTDMGSELSKEALQHLEKLVGFDTVSHKSNMALIDYVRAFLDTHGIESELLPSEDGTKANLFATIGPSRDGGVVFSGHTDVVPVAGQTWDSDPFSLTRREDLLFGRGACDMKGFIAVVLAAVPRMDTSKLRRPFHLAFSYDEEVGCTGVRSMVDAIGKHLPMPEIVVVGEPTSMRVVHAHKGFLGFKTEIFGKPAHSSLPHLGVNANLIAVELIDGMQRIISEAAESKKHSKLYSPPHTTFNVGRIEGGEAINIVAKTCRFIWEIRPVDYADMTEIVDRFNALSADIEARIRKDHPEFRIETESTARMPPFVPEDDSPAETLLKRLLGANESFAVTFGTEASLFQQKGMSVVVCGPGSIEQAHKENEFVSLEQLCKCEKLVADIVDWASSDS